MTHSAVLPAAHRLPLRLDDDDSTYRLVRAWPRSPQHLLLEWERREEGMPPVTVVGQWFADPTALAEAVDATPPPARRAGPACSTVTSRPEKANPSSVSRRSRSRSFSHAGPPGTA